MKLHADTGRHREKRGRGARGEGAARGPRQVNNYEKGGNWPRAASPAPLGSRGCEVGGLGAVLPDARVPGEETGACGGRQSMN